MVEKIKVTNPVAQVLGSFLGDIEAERYGRDLMKETGLSSGTLYPILLRLERAGWLRAAWEDIDPEQAGRPQRRFYRLTPDGAVAAREELAVLRERMSRVLGPLGKPRTT